MHGSVAQKTHQATEHADRWLPCRPEQLSVAPGLHLTALLHARHWLRACPSLWVVLMALGSAESAIAVTGPLALLGNASYPVSVRRLDGFATPLLSALPSRSAPCGSLRSLRPSSGRTFTSGPLFMLGTPQEGPALVMTRAGAFCVSGFRPSPPGGRAWDHDPDVRGREDTPPNLGTATSLPGQARIPCWIRTNSSRTRATGQPLYGNVLERHPSASLLLARCGFSEICRGFSLKLWRARGSYAASAMASCVSSSLWLRVR